MSKPASVPSIPFSIPEPVMPTPEQHREVSLNWLSRVQPTLIDQWPAELAALSMPTTLVKLDIQSILNGLANLHDGNGFDASLVDLAAELDAKIGWDRKFIRLNSRSPKDYPWPFEVPATISGKEAVHILMNSMRVMDDLMEFRWVPEQPAYVALRDYDPLIQAQNEFRCFVKNGELIAVTHYDYTKDAPVWVVKTAEGIRAGIDHYFTTKLKPVLHIDTVVFDIAIRTAGEIRLIEINPYGLSDPCNFGSYEAVENASSFIEMRKDGADQ